jgi:hypothetical protein
VVNSSTIFNLLFYHVERTIRELEVKRQNICLKALDEAVIRLVLVLILVLLVVLMLVLVD